METEPSAQATGVSAREAEVLAGIAEHLTNAEIAERLFISVRTVETHVSSLLRKLGVGDRRALAGLATAVAAGVAPLRSQRGAAPLPAPLTPFVGRAAERAALVATLTGHRLVTAVGPGGVGKTRLALAVAAQIAGRFRDGVWYADLVPVTDPAMVAVVLAAALGLGEQAGRSAEETVLAWLGDRETLLVLDNCEHIVDGVVVLAERILAACPAVTVLATSRARLLVPYERVYSVPGMTVEGDGGDAVDLFLDRAAAADGLAGPVGRHRVAEICRGLDGMALAIELAAARLPVLGLDGLAAGLDDRLRLLAGGRRLDDRHRSLRSALDWSYALLTEAERAILRRVSVFATPFSTQAAAALLARWPPPISPPIASSPPISPPIASSPAISPSAVGPPAATAGAARTDSTAPDVAAGLAGLAEHSLLAAVTGPDGTRYRALETIRQYGAERLRAEGELAEAHARHLRWCLAEAGALDDSLIADRPEERAAFDKVVGELRAALDWVASASAQRPGTPGQPATAQGRPTTAPDHPTTTPDHPATAPYQPAGEPDQPADAAGQEAGGPGQRADGYRLAIRLAELCFARGLPGEAQRRYEQAAALAADDHEAASALRNAASAAEIRNFGGEAIRLHRLCADTALRAGDRPRAAYHVAQIAELIGRAPGLMPRRAALDAAVLIAEASALAGGDPAAEARVAVAQGFNSRETGLARNELAERGIELARRAGDPLAESAALDLKTATQLARGDIRAAAASALRRTELLAPLRRRAIVCGLELFDTYQMAAETAIATGDLAAARKLAEQVRDLPFYREEGHLATARLLVVTALAGDWDETAAFGARFREGWERAGRPRAGNLNRAPYAAAAVCGLRGDDAGRAQWLTVVDGLVSPFMPISEIHHGEFFDALVLLHGGRAAAALSLLATPPEDFWNSHSGIWRPWYAALWAEAAVLAGDPAAASRIGRARRCADGNPVALAIVERAAALAAADRAGLLTAARRLSAAGCRYQWARTLVLAGGPERARGEDELAAMGATPMA